MQKRWKVEGSSPKRKALVLSKETLRQLGNTDLQAAIGGTDATDVTCRRGHIPAGGADSADCGTVA